MIPCNMLLATLVLLRPLANAENLPIAALVRADCNQQRDVAHLAGPAALEHDAVEINIRVLALDRTVAPGLDRPVDLLVQVRHRRGRYPCPPQCLRDVLDPAHRYPRQIHLDQRLLDRALAPPIALDDGRLERLPAQLRYPRSAGRARSGRRGYRDARRCAHSVAHCTADPPRHRAKRSTFPPRFPAPPGRGGS